MFRKKEATPNSLPSGDWVNRDIYPWHSDPEYKKLNRYSTYVPDTDLSLPVKTHKLTILTPDGTQHKKVAASGYHQETDYNGRDVCQTGWTTFFVRERTGEITIAFDQWSGVHAHATESDRVVYRVRTSNILSIEVFDAESE